MPDQPPSSRRERKRQQTADHLAATAFRLFEANGYDAVAMEQIAAAADVAKGTLYNHFSAKEALLAHQFRTEIAAGMGDLGPLLMAQSDFRSRMRVLLQASARWNASRRPYLPHYLRYRLTRIGMPTEDAARDSSGSHGILESLFRAAQERGDLRPEISPAQLAVHLEFMLMGAILLWLQQPDDDLEPHFLAALAVLLDGVATPAKVVDRRTPE